MRLASGVRAGASPLTRTAIISDIHGNAIALRAVVAELDADGIDRVVCLGDVCQGGSEPGVCVDLRVLLGHDPNDFELAVFSLLCSEHCGYKHSALLLKRLPSEGERVLQGPGENAGVRGRWSPRGGGQLSIELRRTPFDAREVAEAHLTSGIPYGDEYPHDWLQA